MRFMWGSPPSSLACLPSAPLEPTTGLSLGFWIPPPHMQTHWNGDTHLLACTLAHSACLLSCLPAYSPFSSLVLLPTAMPIPFPNTLPTLPTYLSAPSCFFAFPPFSPLLLLCLLSCLPFPLYSSACPFSALPLSIIISLKAPISLPLTPALPHGLVWEDNGSSQWCA